MKNCFVLKIACLLIFSTAGQNVFAQLLLKQTNWAREVNLSFANDTLMVSNKVSHQTILTCTYKQTYDTLSVSGLNDKSNCGSGQALYSIIYRHSGQQLYLHMISDGCTNRSNLLGNNLPFNCIPGDGAAPRDWLYLDPEADSVAGISLYKAYALLRGRKPTTIIVAVIDNGVDIGHEDLKNIIWTNAKEIPGNGIDDDHNGFVDDVHGWNFRGAKDGTTVENEQSEATHVYSMWKDKFFNADTSLLDSNGKKEWAVFEKAKKEHLENIKASKDSFELKYTLNPHYNSSEFIGDNPADPNERHYGSPVINVSPNRSHGTHVAGIIAAKRDNNKGIDGIAGNVRIMPVIATTAGGDERDKDVANAIRYAVDNGAKVINMSFSKPFSAFKKVVDEAVRYAEKKHVLIIHAAGNVGDDNDTANHYPVATYDNGNKASNFITVGWSRPLFNYRLAHPYSDYGKRNVDLFAPGSDIFSTVPGNGYDFKSGSSMSAPCVAGVAALLLSYFPSLSAEQVKEILLKSTFKPNVMVNRPDSKTKVPFNSLSASGGILNAYNAVKMAIDLTERK